MPLSDLRSSVRRELLERDTIDVEGVDEACEAEVRTFVEQREAQIDDLHTVVAVVQEALEKVRARPSSGAPMAYRCCLFLLFTNFNNSTAWTCILCTENGKWILPCILNRKSGGTRAAWKVS